MKKINAAAGILFFAIVCGAGAAQQTQASAELRIDQPFIYPVMLDEPLPKDGSRVDKNPPWLHFRIPLVDGTEKTKQEAREKQEELGHRLYYFKLSQDPALEKNVIASQPKRWSFFNPYQPLAKGTWHWKYGVASDKAPQNIKWSDKTHSFTITGQELQAVCPSPQELLKAIQSRPRPHILMRHEDIGKLMPEDHPQIKASLLKDFENRLKNPLEMKIIADESTYPARLPQGRKFRYYQMATLDQYTKQNKQVQAFLRAYLMTGDEKYKKAGLADFWKLYGEYHGIMQKYGNRPGYPDDFSLEGYVKTSIMLLDGFYDDLTPAQRTDLIEYLFKAKKEGYLSYEKQLEFSEHVVYKAHLWQAGVQTLLLSSIVLAPYKEEARTWLEYIYEMWLYRNPGAGRNDGGWHEGNGYFGANERALLQTPYVLKELTGYDFFKEPWYQNVAKYLSYSAPQGNPGAAFADSVGVGGAEQPFLIEALAYLHPENAWARWRVKNATPMDQKRFAAMVGENEAAWTLLSIWKHHPKPDVASVKPPEALAAVFPDLGYVGMHTDLTDPSKNLLVNFRSCLVGQINHAHPAQNAFNMAFGGEPLFWRTGYYHADDLHKAESFKHSRAHNTILANGVGQACAVTGYGWVPRFVTGERISYVLGDASHAYVGAENDPGVTRFRRHVALLRPSTVVVYDELEAKQPIPWTFLLQGREKIEKVDQNAVSIHNGRAVATATVFCQTPVETTVTDKFFAPAKDERGEQKNGAAEFPNQWHTSFTTGKPVQAVRFLAVIEVTPTGDRTLQTKALHASGTDLVKVQAGDYTISAQLDAGQPSFLEVRDRKDTAALVTGQAAREVRLGNDTRVAKQAGSTLLLEKNTRPLFIEEVDRLPDAVKDGNLY